jgi:MFS family permease
MRNRNYALLWTGQLVSEMGNRFHWIAISLWIYALTHSASAVSIAVASMFGGSLFASVWAGAIADRFNRKAILVGSDIVRAVLVALIPSLVEVGLWIVYLDLILISVASGFFRPAMFSIIPQVVSRGQLLSANSFFSAMDTSTEIIGPALAGLLAVRIGYAPLLYLDAISYGFSALCILGMHIAATVPFGKAIRKRIWGEVAEGIGYVRKDHLQWALFVLIIPAYLVGSGLNALQTPLAKGVVGIGDREFGIFNSVWGAGFLVASLLLGWYGRFLSRSLLIVGGFFVQFAVTLMMGFSKSYTWLLVTGFGVGFTNTLSFVGLSTLLMQYTPSSFMGRVVSTRQLALHMVRITSPLLFGNIADYLGVSTAIALMTLVGAVGTSLVSLTLIPLLRRIDLEGSLQQEDILPSKHVLGGLDESLDQGAQIRLNYASVAIVGFVWFYLAFSHTTEAFWIILSVAAIAYIGGLARRRKWLP